MTKIHLFNWNTFSRKFSHYLAIGLAGLTIWFGAEEISDWRESRRLESEKMELKNAGISKLELTVKNLDINSSLKTLEELRNLRIYNLDEISKMENPKKKQPSLTDF